MAGRITGYVKRLDLLSVGVVIGFLGFLVGDLPYRHWGANPSLFPAVVSVVMLIVGRDRDMAEKRVHRELVRFIRYARWILLVAWGTILTMALGVGVWSYLALGRFVNAAFR